jgi:hypothetical protein
MRMPLHSRILLGGALGAAAGIAAHLLFGDSPYLERVVTYVTGPAGKIFLRLLFMLVIPLLFSALVLGVAGMGDPRRLGRVGLKTLAYTVVVSAIAVFIGVTLVNVFQPGGGISPELKARLLEGAAERSANLATAAAPPSGIDLLVQIVPDNPVKAAANGDMLAVIFFSLLLGIGLALTPTPAAERFGGAVEGLFDVSMRLIHMVLAVAPFGVFALLFNLTAELGYEILGQLARYVLVVLLALALHQLVVYSLAVRLLGGMSPLTFFRGIQEAMVTAFFEQRHAADGAPGGGGGAAAAARDQPLRAHRRSDDEPERHRPLRGGDGAVPGPVLRHRPLGGAADDGGGDLHPRRHRHRRRALGVDSGDRDDPRPGGHPGRGDRAGLGRRPLPRHVPDGAQRERRPGGGGRGVQRRRSAAGGRLRAGPKKGRMILERESYEG